MTGFGEHKEFWGEALYPEWQRDEPVTVAAVREIDPSLEDIDRLLGLMQLALVDLIVRSKIQRAEIARTALLVALPADDDVVGRWRLTEHFTQRLGERTGAVFAATSTDTSGHTGRSDC